MLQLVYTNAYKKDVKRVFKQHQLTKNNIKVVTDILQAEKPLPKEYLDYPLNNSKHYKNCRECHIKPDLLLVYKIKNKQLILELLRLGSHSELFKESITHIFEDLDKEQLIEDVTTEYDMNMSEVNRVRELLTGNEFKETQKLNGVCFDYNHSDEAQTIRAQFYIDTTLFEWQAYVSTHTILQADDYVNEGNIGDAYEGAIELLDKCNSNIMLQEKFTSDRNRDIHFDKHVLKQGQYKKLNVTEYEKLAEVLQSSNIDNKNIFGYISLTREGKTAYTKYSKNTEDFVVYTYFNKEPRTITFYKKDWRTYNSDKAIEYYDEIPQGK